MIKLVKSLLYFAFFLKNKFAVLIMKTRSRRFEICFFVAIVAGAVVGQQLWSQHHRTELCTFFNCHVVWFVAVHRQQRLDGLRG